MSSETHDPALGAHRSDSSDSGLLGPGGPPATEGETTLRSRSLRTRVAVAMNSTSC